MKKLSLALVAVTVLFACQTPKVMRYYKSEKGTQTITSKTSMDSLFEINAFVLDPSVGANKTISDLSDKGQGALIEALNSKTKTSQELVDAIAAPLEEAVTPGSTKGSITWKKRVVISIAKMDNEAANRFQQVWFTLEIPDSYKGKVEFVSWDKIITETQTYDLGKITSSRTVGFSVSPEITMAGFVQGKLPGAVSGSSTSGEEKSFTGKFAGLSAAVVNPSKFVMSRQALPNENISGNIVIEFTLKSTQSAESLIYDFSGFYNGETVVSDQSKIEFVRSLTIKPDFGTISVIPINLTYKFHYRTVGKGKRTEPEYDDQITYLDGIYTDSSKFNLFNTAETRPSMWKISDGSNYLHLSNAGQTEVLQFSSYNKATQLLNWIRLTKNSQVANYQLVLGLKNFTAADIPNLRIQLAE
ncbi:hypothetical protein [Fluviicola sp.]|uniref:hypothetical protein n=1 Tax=Fluviicola sp. TaxID=1917219 RepID=UPI003D29F4D8